MTTTQKNEKIVLLPDDVILENIIEKYASRYIPEDNEKEKEKPTDVMIWICA